MSLGDRFGIVGLIVALLSVAAFYLWPERKGIGWIALATAFVFCLVWFYLERKELLLMYATHPVKTTIAVGIAGGILIAITFAGVASRFTAKRETDAKPGPPTGDSQPPPSLSAEQSLRLKYSSMQVIQISNEPGDYNETLNLDSAATMIHSGAASLDSIEMVLPASTPLTVDSPKAGHNYPVGGGGTVRFPAADTPGISIKSATMLDITGSFVFDRFKSGTKIIEVGKRQFRVALMAVRDKSTGKHKLVEYTFGISEE